MLYTKKEVVDLLADCLFIFAAYKHSLPEGLEEEEAKEMATKFFEGRFER